MRQIRRWAVPTGISALLIVAGCSAAGPVTPGSAVPVTESADLSGASSGSLGPPGPADPVEEPGLSTTDLPTSRPPMAPPSTPSDLIGGVWALGTVTGDGNGECFGFVTDDGQEFALYGPGAGPLPRGTRLRVLLRSPFDREVIDCAGSVRILLEVKTAG